MTDCLVRRRFSGEEGCMFKMPLLTGQISEYVTLFLLLLTLFHL